MEKKIKVAFTEERWMTVTRALSHYQMTWEDAIEKAKDITPAAMEAAKKEIFEVACMMDDIIDAVKEAKKE